MRVTYLEEGSKKTKKIFLFRLILYIGNHNFKIFLVVNQRSLTTTPCTQLKLT